MKKILLQLIFTILSLIIFQNLLIAQKYNNEISGPAFKLKYFIKASASPDSGYINVRMEIPYSEILFLKDKSNFEGRIDISLNINKDGKRVLGHTNQKIIRIDNFEQTISKNNKLIYVKSFHLKLAEYDIIAVVSDINTQSKRKIEKKADLKILKSDKWVMGKLYVIEEKVKKNDKDENTISFGFSAYGLNGTQSFSYKILNNSGKKISNGDFKINLINEPTEYFFKIPTNDLTFKQYELVVTTSVEEVDFKRSVIFHMRWTGMNSSIVDIDLAIKQMRYLLMTNYITQKELNIIRDAKKEQKQITFTDFWKTLDPTPDSDINEMQNEYYRRINEANSYFDSTRPGWESDRGMVYTIFGPPDDKEIHNFELHTKPYIIWYYYRLNKYFVFVDYTGFGEFQLNQPIFDAIY